MSTGAQKLVSKTSTNLFEPGQSDDFELSNQADVGELTSVVVTMTGSMNIFKSDSWLLQSLIIQKQPPGKTWPFTCNQYAPDSHLFHSTAQHSTSCSRYRCTIRSSTRLNDPCISAKGPLRMACSYHAS